MNRTVDMARNKWKGILLELGVERSFLSGRHGPCPMCEGKDRFRFDNKDGKGTYFCSGCGAGSGFDLVQKLKGWDFKTAAQEVDKIVGRVQPVQPKAGLSPERQVEALRELWGRGVPITGEDPASRYLIGRNVPLPQNRLCLRYAERCFVPGGGVLPAMIALVTAPDGKPATIHRTFLGPNGKADIPNPRAAMPGEIPAGAAIRLSMHGDRLGIAEGIETALKASERFGMPVWAAINSTMLAKWQPPTEVRDVIVFGDNDAKFGGAAAAYALAHRLACQPGLRVDVAIPSTKGRDWADADAA